MGRLGITVDEDRTPGGRPFAGNAAYSAVAHALYFARDDNFPGAADSTVVIHELGHAVWHALCGNEPAKNTPSSDDNAIYEGWADAFAAMVTEQPVFGRWWIGATDDPPRTSLTRMRHAPSGDGHRQGQVYSGLFWDLSRGRSRSEWRQLVLGAVHLAPQPVTPSTLVAGLLMADRTFHGGRHASAIIAAAQSRGLPVTITR